MVALILGSLILASVGYSQYTLGQKAEYEFVRSWGKSGTGVGEFHNPAGIDTDRLDNVYVVDSINRRIQKFSSDGAFVSTWGTEGVLNGQFLSPVGIAVDSRGNVFVTDQNNNNVQKFDSNGKFLKKWGTKPLPRNRGFGLPAEDYLAQLGHFNVPSGIAVDSSGNVYVVDTGNHRIQKFTSAGKFITAWGSLGRDDGKFNRPVGIAIDRDDYIYVADTTNNRIQQFDTEGNFVKAFSTEVTGLADILSVAVDQLGYLYVTGGVTGQIQVFYQGNFIGEFKLPSTGAERSFHASGIAVSASGDIYVTDYFNDRVHKFTKSSKMPNIQLFANDLEQVLTYFSEEQAGKMTLLPSSVNGIIVTSGRSSDEFGNIARVGEQPSLPPGQSAKVVAYTLRNDDLLEHRLRLQIGYLDIKGNFVTGYDSTIFLSKHKSAGDSMLVKIEPFFVPADQLTETGMDYFMKRFGHTPDNFIGSGTNIVARLATDGSNVPTELSLSLILNP